MAEQSYFGYIVILFTIFIIVISIWNLFAFDKSNEDESVFFIINIIAIILSVIILVWAIYEIFSTGPTVVKTTMMSTKTNGDVKGVVFDPSPVYIPTNGNGAITTNGISGVMGNGTMGVMGNGTMG